MKRAIVCTFLCASLALPALAHANGSPEKFGFIDDKNICTRPACTYSQKDIDLAAEAGFRWVRYLFYWNQTNPAEGKFDWSMPDQEIARLKKAGLKVYASIAWAPPWAAHDSLAYTPFYCMEVTEHGGKFDPSKGDCANPPIPSPQARFDYVQALLERYGDDIDAIGCGLEAGDRIFWPSGDFDAYINTLLAVCYDATQATRPNIPVVGPGEIHPGWFSRIMWRENHMNKPLFDVISFHVYYGPRWELTVDGMQRMMDQKFEPVITQLGGGRPVWIDESGIRGPTDITDPQGFVESQCHARKIRALFESLEDRPWIDKFFLYRLRGGCHRNEGHTILDCDGNPLPAWWSIRSYLTPGPQRSAPIGVSRDLLSTCSIQ